MESISGPAAAGPEPPAQLSEWGRLEGAAAVLPADSWAKKTRFGTLPPGKSWQALPARSLEQRVEGTVRILWDSTGESKVWKNFCEVYLREVF